MNEFFGAWVALGMFGATLLLVLAHYAFGQYRRKEGSSFFSLEFVWRLAAYELIPAGLSFTLGIGFGAGVIGTENDSLMIFFGLLAILVIVALLVLHYSAIISAHRRASRSRRLQGKRRVLKAA